MKANIKFRDLENKTSRELTELLKEQGVNLGKLRFELNNKSLKDSSLLSKTRKDIARIMTAIGNQSKLDK